VSPERLDFVTAGRLFEYTFTVHKSDVLAEELHKLFASNERQCSKPMDHEYCPVGFLREHAHKVAAIGLRIAVDDLQLRWSWQAQIRYDAKKSVADKALTAWQEHIQYCPTCRDARVRLEPDELKPDVVASPVLLLVDDSPLFLQLLGEMLQGTYKIAAALSSGAEVVEQAAALLPDLIILDISLGAVNGFEVARRLKIAGCPAKIIFLTLHEDMAFVAAAFTLGASGFVCKSRLATDLENAIVTVFSGGRFGSVP
jgi:CheY-like chemotaxis protein